MAEPIATIPLTVHAQEPDSFRALYECHHARIYALAWRMCGNAQHAEDLTQDVFVRLWDAITSFRGESAFSTWLHEGYSYREISDALGASFFRSFRYDQHLR